MRIQPDTIGSEQGPQPHPAQKVAAVGAMTVDVEEWFHAHNLKIHRDRWDGIPSRLDRPTDLILSSLADAGTKGTFFVLGWVALRRPDLVRRIHSAGHEIACHGHDHVVATGQTQLQFMCDVRRAKSILEDITGSRVNGYRAPSYSLTPEMAWAFDALVEAGFKYDSSIYPVKAPHGRYGTGDAPRRPYQMNNGLWEFPLPTVALAGRRFPACTGAYFRLAPLAVSNFAIAQNLRHATPVVVNVHPWEFDVNQPRVPTSRWHRLLHYSMLSSTHRKLVKLLALRRFTSMNDLYAAHAGQLADHSIQKHGEKEVAGLAAPPDTSSERPARAVAGVIGS